MTQGRLLVLDDDETIGQLLAFVAQRAGFEARWCDRPQPFFDAVRDWRPSHLAIDLAMPEMGGIDVMRALAEAACPAWIIVSSGAGPAETDAALRQAEALGLRTAGALAKPFSLSSVRALLAQVRDETEPGA